MNRLLDRISLRARLVAVVTALLVVALVAVGLATLAALRLVLVGEIDRRLSLVIQDERQLARLAQETDRGPGSQPTDYVVQLNDAAGRAATIRAGPTVPDDALPRLEGITLASVHRAGGEPFTVDGWRVVGRGIPVNVPPDQQTGSVLVALSLEGVEDTLVRLERRLVLLGVVVVVSCALLGWAAVHGAFRPLRDVEAVTAAFADGDTSRRVPPQPSGTEVGRLGAAVNAMLDRIETSLAAREASEARMRRFVGDASHELRTPLAAVRGFAELYRQGAVRSPEEVARAFARIEQESARMGGLVDDLLTLARLDEQRPLREEPVDLLVVAADAVHDATALAPDRDVRLTGLDGAAAPSPAVVLGDDARLRQVLANLIGNAVRHTPPGTPLQIGVGSRDGWALCQVVDHGPGIPEEHRERVFERFYRADSSRARSGGGGSGLGLAIVAALVHAHGGAVRVMPTPGGGATLEVALPLASVDADSQEALSQR